MKRILLLLLTALVLTGAPASAQDKVGTTGALFLTLPSSARQWGLGGAGAAIVDPFVAHFNPGGLGVYALTCPVGIARNSQDWAPHFLYDSDVMTTANTLILTGFPITRPGGPSWPRVWAAIAFHRYSLNTQRMFYSYSGSINRRTTERSDGWTLALGIEKGIEVGVGGAAKFIMESSSDDARDTLAESRESTLGWDCGVFVRVPVQQILTEWRVLERPLQLGPFTPEIAITGSYAWANRRGELDNEPLPRLARFGRTIEVRLDYRDLPVIVWLATRDDVTSKLDRPEERHEGWEVDVFGVVRFQKGDEPGSNGFESHGMSVHPMGCMRWVADLEGDRPQSGLPWWITNFDIFYRFAKIDDAGDPLLEGTEFKEFGFTLNAGPLWQ